MLCADSPEASVYLSDQFWLDGGPIFNRGPLDGSARLLITGQDPAQHETIVAKLGITRSYAFMITYLYTALVRIQRNRRVRRKG